MSLFIPYGSFDDGPKQGSTSNLQRRMKLGYNRADRFGSTRKSRCSRSI